MSKKSWDERLGVFLVFNLPVAWFLFTLPVAVLVEFAAVKFGLSWRPSLIFGLTYLGGFSAILAALYIRCSWFRTKVPSILCYWIVVWILFRLFTGTTEGALRSAVNNAISALDKIHDERLQEAKEKR